MFDSEFATSYAALNIPKCCLQLESLHFIAPTDIPKEHLQSSEHVTSASGFMLQYSVSKWEAWLESFCQQSNSRYSVDTGKQHNKKEQHGTIQIQKQLFTFKIEWSQMHNFYRAGQGQLIPEVSDPLKRRNAPGSRCCGCPAAIVVSSLLVINKEFWKYNFHCKMHTKNMTLCL